MKISDTNIPEPQNIEDAEDISDNQPEVEQPEPSAGGTGTLAKVVIVLLLLTAGGAGGAAYYYRDQAAKLKVNPQEAAQAEVSALIAKVSQLILLPTDEEPTVATVADPDKLKDQVFFKNAHKGDKVLIYTTARKAVLYDPVAHKIIEVAPVSIGPETAAAAPPPPPPPAGQ